MEKSESEKIIKKMCNAKMRELGLKSNKSRNMWTEDCGYYAVVVNLYPQKGFGVAFMVAIYFLWNESQSITFDYYRGDSPFLRVPGTQGIGEALLYDDMYLEEHLKKILKSIESEIKHFRTLDSYEKMLSELQSKSSLETVDASIGKNLGCLYFILSDPSKACNTFKYSQTNCKNMFVKSEIEKYIELTNHENEFLTFLNNNIELNRKKLQQKFPKAFSDQYILKMS